MAGILGTRADLIIDVVMIASTLLPLYLLFTFNLAKEKKFAQHKKAQFAGFVAVTLLVLALEVDVRFGGLSDISVQSPYHDSAVLSWVFFVHMIFAVSTFVGWIWLLVKSARIYPKNFASFNHKKWGKLLFVDILLTIVTGWGMYYLVFVA
jgi:uncharacterized membrane protein YozB (DUF420 family)